MEQLLQAVAAVLALVLTAVAKAAFDALRDYAANLVQERLGAGAARIAGQISAEVAGDDRVLVATREMVEAGVAEMRRRFPDTAGKLPAEAIAGMIVGELGKLGQAVAR